MMVDKEVKGDASTLLWICFLDSSGSEAAGSGSYMRANHENLGSTTVTL